MCSKRGLVENTDEQTFIMALPRKLRMKYEQVLLPAQLEVPIVVLFFACVNVVVSRVNFSLIFSLSCFVTWCRQTGHHILWNSCYHLQCGSF